MDRTSQRCSRFHLVVVASALGACGGSAGGSGPGLSTIPPQVASSGVVSIDLASFVAGDASSFEFAVVDGGGEFDGSVYENTFPTIGSYTVTFDVGVGTARSRGTFDVEVEQADLVVVQRDSSHLTILDAATEQLVEQSASAFAETFRAGLSGGQLVYERDIGGNVDLHVFDLFARRPITVANASDRDETFVLTLSDGSVLFSVSDGSDADLKLWNPDTRFLRIVSAVSGETERNAFATDDDLVFFERVDDGDGDIWYYDPGTDVSVAVSTHAANETLLGVAPNGGVVFGRPGDQAETDLFYFSRATGLLEIGLDVTALDTLEKTFDGASSDGRIVFTATDANAGIANVWVWEPAEARSTLASSTTSTEVNTFRAITAGDVVVFEATDTANPGTDDVFGYSIGDDAVEQANAGDDDHAFAGAGRIDGEDFVVFTIAGVTTSIHVYNFATDSRRDAAAASYRADAVLSDGRVVITQTTAGGGLFLYDAAADTMTSVIAGVGVPVFRSGGAPVGDLVFELDVGGQADLFLWDDSESSVVTVSDDAAPDTFQAVAPSGRIVFRRVLAGNTTGDLFLFDPSDLTTVRLTTADGIGDLHDHAVVGSYAVDR